MSTTPATKGLEGVVAANSGICYIDGDEGILAYRGIDIHDLADNSSFEEVCYLLWFGHLPKREELEHVKHRLVESRVLDPKIIDMMRNFPKSATPMEVLRTAVSALSFYDPDEKAVDHDSNVRKSYARPPQFAMVVPFQDSIRYGHKLVR